MRVEKERRDTHRKNRNPEIHDPPSEQRQRHIQQHHQRPHSQVDTWPSKSGVQNAERKSSRREPTTSCDVPSSTKREISCNGMRGDLSGEDFESGGR